MPTVLPPYLLQKVMPSWDRSRRQFLRASLVGGASLLISARISPRKRLHNGRVLVIGAGLAGLSCAYELQHAGMSVTVLEARRRVGGRVLSTTMKDHHGKKQAIELGGELIGLQHTVWNAYAQRFGLKLEAVDDHDTSLRVFLNGELLDEKASIALANEVATACNIMNADAADVLSDTPWLHPNAATLDHLNVADWLYKIDISSRAKAYLANYFGTLNGVGVAKQSYLAHLAAVSGGGFAAYWTDSEQLRCKQGSQSLARSLAAAIGQNNIHLGCPVRHVTHNSNNCIVKAVDGRLFEADTVVYAIPPSTWGRVILEPELPKALAPQIGDAVKAIVSPKTPFWGKTPQSIGDNAICATWASASKAALVCFSGGASAEKVRGQSPHHIAKRYSTALHEIFPDYAPDVAMRKARIDWRDQIYTRGGYSVPAPGSIMNQGALLQQDHGSLHIAGEHTSYSFWGYMEGALRSGAAVADRIVKSASTSK